MRISERNNVLVRHTLDTGVFDPKFIEVPRPVLKLQLLGYVQG